MESLKKICFRALPPRLESALLEQLARGLSPLPLQVVPEMTAADLIVAGAEAPQAGMPRAVPVIALAGRKLRLGAVLRQIRQVLEEPALYLEPFALGDYVFYPQEKLLRPAAESDAAGDIDLTDKEVELLVYLAKRHAAPVSRDDLLRDVWRYQDGLDTHTLETHIYRLRQKIEKSADNPQLLVTGEQGYFLNL